MQLIKSCTSASSSACGAYVLWTPMRPPCWIFVDALEQSHLYIHFNHSVPALILSSHRRQRFGLMLLPPVRLKQKTVMSGKVSRYALFASLSLDSSTLRGQVRCESSLLSRKRTISLYSSPSMCLGLGGGESYFKVG